MKKYSLTLEEECEFEELVFKMQDTINLALYKCNIKNYNDFYSFALEGLLVSFLMLKKGVLTKEDFKKFAYVTMKRKIIDEIRRRSKENVMLCEKFEDTLLFKDKKCFEIEIDFKESILKILTPEEKEFLTLLTSGFKAEEIALKMNISRSKSFLLLKKVRKKSEKLLHNCC